MTTEYTRNEVARHCTADDLWIIFDGKVHNMTPYFEFHPGGSAMLRQAGKKSFALKKLKSQDASAAMRLVHMHGISWSAIEKKLEECKIGVLKHLGLSFYMKDVFTRALLGKAGTLFASGDNCIRKYSKAAFVLFVT
ncbi:cytochrome b5-like Heme/Steroid binding domain protein [Necator americanus]|uniref:Cytochrome b5-like Heme/Steroid binding domain protein n=1 Tax=Necator americanus TaxID=51031 RepID=W2T823_NECAM|nr:cytochrome b5-like Heme/Steroid binding domain protein [Necator americanus]ETN78038.1 cytochrome b5-like Heme/Steroid binding domain protein [Necator americanus]